MEDLNNSLNVEPQSDIVNNTDSSINSDDSNNLSGIFDDDNNSDMSLSDDTNIEPATNENNSDNINNDTNSITYYTQKELEEFSKPENVDTIDVNRIPPELRWAIKLFQKPYTQKQQKLSEDKKAFENEKSEFEKDKLTFQEQLEQFRKEQEKVTTQDVLETGRLSQSDESNIINIAVSKTQEYLGDELDTTNPEHISVFNSIKNNLSNAVMQKRVSESISNRLENRYGADYVYVERAVQQKFKSLPYNDGVTFLNARSSGRYDIIEKFYDTVYNDLINELKQNNNINTNNNTNTIKPKNIPPNTIGNTKPATMPKSSKNEMYDTTGIF